MNIYVASSWRNDFQPHVVERLRAAGHTVYDFKNPQGAGPGTGFAWAEIDPNWRQWKVKDYLLALTHAKAQAGFESDERGMVRADACVLVLPAGRSAHVEFGWMVGRGKLGYVLLSEEGFDPDLMYLLVPHRNLCTSIDELLQKLKEDTSSHDDELQADYSPRARPESRRLTLRSSCANPPFSNLSKPAADDVEFHCAGTYRASAQSPNVTDLSKPAAGSAPQVLSRTKMALRRVLDGSPSAPPVMPHITTSPKEPPPAGEIPLGEPRVCNLEPFKPVFAVVAQLKGAVGGPPVGDEYRASGLGGKTELARGTADWCRTVLTAEGYSPLDEAGRAALAKDRNLPDGELWVNTARLKAAEEWFDKIVQYLP